MWGNWHTRWLSQTFSRCCNKFSSKSSISRMFWTGDISGSWSLVVWIDRWAALLASTFPRWDTSISCWTETRVSDSASSWCGSWESLWLWCHFTSVHPCKQRACLKRSPRLRRSCKSPWLSPFGWILLAIPSLHQNYWASPYGIADRKAPHHFRKDR